MFTISSYDGSREVAELIYLSYVSVALNRTHDLKRDATKFQWRFCYMCIILCYYYVVNENCKNGMLKLMFSVLTRVYDCV